MPAVIETPIRQPSPELQVMSKISMAAVDAASLDMAAQILDVVQRYRLARPQDDSDSSFPDIEGRLGFLSLIYGKVKARAPITMCLPAFPFKSPNTQDKVLGRLPDKGEELALAHLNGLCASIGDIYEPGAQLTIISDGLVYNDLLGVPDRDVWAYGEALRAMAVAKGFNNIAFSRLADLVHIPNLPAKMDEITYSANATNFRRVLLNNFGRAEYDASAHIAKDRDTCLTYRGYIKFLSTDLAHVYPVGEERSKSKFKAGTEYIAKTMLGRGDAFARAVRENFRSHLRLSIHPGIGATKISISTLPTTSTYTTPWHCSVAIAVNGEMRTGLRSTFEADPAYELVYENGRPSYFREKSELFNWSIPTVAEPIYPAGWVIRPAPAPGNASPTKKSSATIHQIDSAKLRALAQLASPVIARGFKKTDNRELFVAKAHELGTPLPWKFGLVLEVKDRGNDTRGLNNVLSSEWMPFHFDGLFKTQTATLADGSAKVLPNPPRFQLFTSPIASPKHTGFTLFTNSRKVFESLPASLPLERLKQLTWAVTTDSFDKTTMTGIPLVIAHPVTGEPCLRYHEPWPQSKTAFQPTQIRIEGVSQEESDAICETLDALLHDRRNVFWHTWEKGDLLVSDNVLAMHTRSDFKPGEPRELWRIHFD
ncbi:hypothetical protein TD95_003224 [Thielaviopsis punctulata]|uniref:TauD/TfdA-like domain-containing protein n=1 Tax=Thielaviopsis punctulata TaxID=72032 RepID=A0A0F4ZF08_9PEZI|nr:hypothetical protein TD95_003224 [Thielaviopsis punctulata]